MRRSEKKEFLEQVGRLLNSQKVGVLATSYRGTPHQSLIAFVSSEDFGEIYFTTPKYTRKVEAMKTDPGVALLVDNRQNIASDLDACIAVTAKGTAEQLPEQKQDTFLSRYLARHPYLEEFVSSPTCSIYCIRVQSYTLVSSFQKVQELILK